MHRYSVCMCSLGCSPYSYLSLPEMSRNDCVRQQVAEKRERESKTKKEMDYTRSDLTFLKHSSPSGSIDNIVPSISHSLSLSLYVSFSLSLSLSVSLSLYCFITCLSQRSDEVLDHDKEQDVFDSCKGTHRVLLGHGHEDTHQLKQSVNLHGRGDPGHLGEGQGSDGSGGGYPPMRQQGSGGAATPNPDGTGTDTSRAQPPIGAPLERPQRILEIRQLWEEWFGKCT